MFLYYHINYVAKITVIARLPRCIWVAWSVILIVVFPNMQIGALLSSLIARRWVRLQTLKRFRLKDLSIDEMVGARCFGCLSGPPWFTCWISFAPVFSFIYC